MDMETGVTPADAGSEPLSAHEATDRISKLLQGSREATPDDVVEDAKPDAETAEADTYETEEAEGTAEAEAPEAEAEDEPETDTEDDTGDEPDADGGLITLPDGTTATVEEIARWRDTRKNLEADFTKKYEAVASQRKEIEAKTSQLQQQEQILSQQISATMQMLQEVMPPVPDRAMREYDPIGYASQKEDFETAQRRLQYLYATQQEKLARQMQEQQKAREAAIQENKKKLLEAMPELQNEQKRVEMQATIAEGIKTYGFEPEDLKDVYDYRVIQALSDAVKYRKMMAQKPKVEGKAKNTPPVQKPGKRKSSAEQRAQAKRQSLDKLKQTGSPKDAASIISQMLSGNR